jgi:Txe/YoeB family toxin of Txe-Axe toxin-antitoxin module
LTNVQKKYINYLNNIDSFTQGIDIDSIKKIEKLKSIIKNIELVVPVVGGFSAGKSTLINSYLQTDTLPTGMTPETALATELRYSSNEYIEAIKSDDSIDKYDINQSEEIKNKAEQYQYIRLYLNNEKLRQIEPLVLVDMPGFDSPLELHNQAILNYLNKGIYFVILTSVEDGNIQKSTIRELENITEFGKGFSFCLSKVNLRGTSDVSNIKEKIKEQLDDYFDFQQDVIAVSDNGGKELENILSTINIEELFEKLFLDNLKNNHTETIISLDTIIATLKASQEESSIAIKELQESGEKIISKKIKMIEETQAKYSDTGVDSIVEAVSRDIFSNMENLTTMALSNSDSFSREINDIVKNTLIYEVKNKMEDTSNDIVNSFSIEIKDVANSLSSFELGDKWINSISESTKNLIKNAQNGLKTVVENRDTSSTNNLYKSITAVLGITTTMINPLLEVIIVFLPEIIGFFTAKSKEAKQRNEIANKLTTEVIPSIKSKIRSVLPDIFNKQVNSMIETISEQFEDQLKIKEQEISKAKEEKENNIKYEEVEIKNLENIKNELVKLAQKNLY